MDPAGNDRVRSSPGQPWIGWAWGMPNPLRTSRERAGGEGFLASLDLGPAIVFRSARPTRGVLTLGRHPGAMPLSRAATELVTTFAAQAGIALELHLWLLPGAGQARGGLSVTVSSH